ncbi:PEP-CTERM sorting domain-containing protein [Colwellia sp. 12G3]|uniref:PEP-CTERM sorting domain-containing protein n=1 Tax=Colwellia sp. 12G3 TaxID=2058299 RepID=UPI000C3332F3|nr:PEP-CTERM sorting domain-containing protein [Colwellia sp. 12G3]PKI12588.1 hypothetical protein CXF71_17720 [Colwellia sp. 12G3]
MRIFTRFTRFISIVFIALASFSYTAQATLIIELDTIFAEDGGGLKPTPAGSAPWLTATFENYGIDGDTVRLTMESNLGGDDFVGGWYFNLDPLLSAVDLTFNRVDVGSTSGLVPADIWQDGPYKANGEHYYDILFDFVPSGGTKFDGTSTLVYDIMFSNFSLLDELDFDFFGSGGKDKGGPFNSAAHIQGLDGGLSTWIGGDGEAGCTGSDCGGGGGGQSIPEPSILFLLAGGLIALSLRKKIG